MTVPGGSFESRVPSPKSQVQNWLLDLGLWDLRLPVWAVCYNPDMQRDDTDVVVKLKTESRGVVNPAIVRWIAFAVITVSLVACTVLCILAIWKFTESDAVWRAIATFIVVSIATAIFTFVNEKLG